MKQQSPKIQNNTSPARHSRVGGNPLWGLAHFKVIHLFKNTKSTWIPACAGMTEVGFE